MNATELKQEHDDEILVMALASGATEVEAARRAGISDRTVRRRLQDQPFVDRVRAARAEMLGRAAGQSAACVSDAVEVLHELLGSGQESTRLRAAQLVIDVARKLVTDDDVLVRLERLEQASASAMPAVTP